MPHPPDRPGDHFTVIGQRIPPAGGLGKASGATKYPTDISLPGMLWAKILRSPHPHARIARIDTSRAEAQAGVITTLTYRDIPEAYVGVAKGYSFSPESMAITRQPQGRKILDDTVRYVGDYVCVVVAVDEETAEDALELIEVEYELLPAVFEAEEAMRPDAPQIHVEGNVFGGSAEQPSVCYERGNLEEGFQQADRIFEGDYLHPFQNATPLEPRGCVAVWEGDQLTIWDSTQFPYKVQSGLAMFFNLPPEKVRVIASVIGGGYGNKTVPNPYQFIASWLAKKTGRPIKLWFTREEETFSGFQRPANRIHLKAGVKLDGTLTAICIKSIQNTGAWAPHAHRMAEQAAHGATLMYRRCPHARYEAYVVHTNATSAGGAYRGFGDPENQFAIESMLDDIAHTLGIDPISLRRRNQIQEGDELSPMFPGERVSSVGLDECLRRGAERIGWERRQDPSHKAGPRRRGLGMAAAIHSGGIRMTPSHATLQIDRTGKVTLQIGVPDLGTEQQTTQAQLAAEILKVPVGSITTRNADTADRVTDYGAVGSRTTSALGHATLLAAQDVKRQLLELAAKRQGSQADELELWDGQVCRKGVTGYHDGIPYGALLQWARQEGLNGDRLVGQGAFTKSIENSFAFAACFAEVEVDTETGKITLLRLVAAQDVGRAINPLFVEGQIQGTVMQGIGGALSEVLIFDPVNRGTLLNQSFIDYEVPTSLDSPDVEAIIVEAVEPLGAFGAKGGGETSIIATAPAITNAIFNAMGIRFTEIPVTPEKVLAALAANAVVGVETGGKG